MNAVLTLEDDFCDVLSKAIAGKGVDAETTAAELEVTATIVENWCEGTSLPREEIMPALCAFLGLGLQSSLAARNRNWHPGIEVPDGVEMYLQPTKPYRSNGYLITCGNELAVIDPAGDPDDIFDRIGAHHGKELRYILITHRHPDHCDAAPSVHSRFPHAQIYMPAIESEAVPALVGHTRAASDNLRLPFGTSVVNVIALPGHTDGSVCFRLDQTLWVGDAFFAGSVGRCFAMRTNYSQQLANIRRRIFPLGEEMVVLPGHGPLTTLGLEQQHNPFFAH